MDHFPLPTKHHPNGHLNIPCIVTEEYDKGPFAEYPRRLGWEYPAFLPRDVLVATDILHHGKPSTISELQPVLQNWLFFGTLHELFGDHVALSDFVVIGDDGSKRLCTSSLAKVVEEWIDGSADATASNEVQREMIKQSCERVYQHLDTVYYAACAARELADATTLLAVSLLGDSLSSIVYIIYNGVLELETPVRPPWARAFAQLLIPYFEERGWCPNIISRFTASGDTRFMAIYYCLNLWRPGSQNQHDTCTADFCAATKIDPATYTVSHVRPDCTCHMVGIDEQQIGHILEQGKVPLLKVDPRQDIASLKPEVQLGSIGEPLVAISHVWADGLGNAQDNALPICSLQRIATLVNELPREADTSEAPMPFWIDSVCVPVRSLNLKQLAMTYLREPYRYASHVLVLDRTIVSISSEGLNIIDVMAYLICSNWIGRLWTLQEGRLGRKVWFQFQDRAVDLHALLEAWYKYPTSFKRPYRRDLFGSFIGTWNATRSFEDLQGPETFNKINHLRYMLEKRSVSVSSDEGLCLFNLAEMDLGVVTAIVGNGELRMKAFWELIDDIPAGLLFSKYPKKLESAGFRWAPSSFMGKLEHLTDWSGDGSISQNLRGISTPHGFLCHLPAFVLELEVSRIPIYEYKTAFFFRNATGWYEASMYEPWHQTPCIAPGPGKQKVALLLMEPLWEKRSNKDTGGANWNLSTRALLAFIIDHVEEAASGKNPGAHYIKCWQHFMVKFDPIDQPINNAAWNGISTLTADAHRSESLADTAGSLAAQLTESDLLLKKQCDTWAAGTNYANGEARLRARILELATPTDDFAGEAEILKEQLWCAD
ncbi:hypothetical protein MMC10_009297 [Thelotrema lepadinum]|nr:hypothetical protein [Thelotrema lepadinum]